VATVSARRATPKERCIDMKPVTKKYAKGGTARKPLKMANGGMMPPITTQGPGDGLAPGRRGDGMQPPVRIPGKPANLPGRPGMPPITPRIRLPGKPAGDVRGRPGPMPPGPGPMPPVTKPGPMPPGGMMPPITTQGPGDGLAPKAPYGTQPMVRFKKGGMVTSKKKTSFASVRPRGASGRGVKACKIS
jgi:hypothetical protein